MKVVIHNHLPRHRAVDEDLKDPDTGKTVSRQTLAQEFKMLKSKSNSVSESRETREVRRRLNALARALNY